MLPSLHVAVASCCHRFVLPSLRVAIASCCRRFVLPSLVLPLVGIAVSWHCFCLIYKFLLLLLVCVVACVAVVGVAIATSGAAVASLSSVERSVERLFLPRLIVPSCVGPSMVARSMIFFAAVSRALQVRYSTRKYLCNDFSLPRFRTYYTYICTTQDSSSC